METFPEPESDSSAENEAADAADIVEPEREYGRQGDGLDVIFSSPDVPEPVTYTLEPEETLPRYVHLPFGRRTYDTGPVDPPGQGRRHSEDRRQNDHPSSPVK